MSILLPSRRFMLSAPWVRNELWRRARVVPSLDLRFAETRSLVDAVTGLSLVTFSRGCEKTIRGATAPIVVASDSPAFEIDPVTGESLGLSVEDLRMQLLEQTDTLATQTKTVTAVPHALSFYGTGTVVLSGAHSAMVVGAGAYPTRTTLTFTPSAGSLTLTVTGSVLYGQLEPGALPTSYIPNAGIGTITRLADVVSISGSNFSSWYRQDEGTMFANWSYPVTPSGFPGIWNFTEGATGAENRFSISTNLFGNNRFGARAQNVTVFDTQQGPDATVNQSMRAAMALKAGQHAFSGNGTTPTTNAGAMPSGIDRCWIGGRDASPVNHLNGHIRRLTYWAHLIAPTLRTLTR